MTPREAFYSLRDARTLEYGIAPGVLGHPVGIVMGRDASESPVGQSILLALINLMARVHRSISVWTVDAPLLASSLVPSESLMDAAERTAHAIDPYLELSVFDPHDLPASRRSMPIVGIGLEAARDCSVFIGSDHFVAISSNAPVAIGSSPSSILGGGLAACLGAGELMRALAGHASRSRQVSIWNFDEGAASQKGPSVVGQIDVGDVAVIGAGAVGSAFAYWTRAIGHRGDWIYVDRDRAELHNTNRCIGLLAADAGWLEDNLTLEPALKAKVAAELTNAAYFEGWYDEWVQASEARPDLVLPLANEFDVRHAIGQRGDPILLHATTSPNWTAEMHRHMAGVDGCINCRLPQRRSQDMRCSTGPLPERAGVHVESLKTAPSTPDAALPFLSAAAGLMLVAALLQLEHGVLPGHRENHWRLLFGTGSRAWSRSIHLCLEGCRSELSPEVRAVINKGRRWANVQGTTNA